MEKMRWVLLLPTYLIIHFYEAYGLVELNGTCNPVIYAKAYAYDRSSYYQCLLLDHKTWNMSIGKWVLNRCSRGIDDEFIEQLQSCKNKAKFRKLQSICQQNPDSPGCMDQKPCAASNTEIAVGSKCSWMTAPLAQDEQSKNKSSFLQCQPGERGASCGRWKRQACPPGTQYDSTTQVCTQAPSSQGGQNSCGQLSIFICLCFGGGSAGGAQSCPGGAQCVQGSCCQPITGGTGGQSGPMGMVGAPPSALGQYSAAPCPGSNSPPVGPCSPTGMCDVGLTCFSGSCCPMQQQLPVCPGTTVQASGSCANGCPTGFDCIAGGCCPRSITQADMPLSTMGIGSPSMNAALMQMMMGGPPPPGMGPPPGMAPPPSGMGGIPPGMMPSMAPGSSPMMMMMQGGGQNVPMVHFTPDQPGNPFQIGSGQGNTSRLADQTLPPSANPMQQQQQLPYGQLMMPPTSMPGMAPQQQTLSGYGANTQQQPATQQQQPMAVGYGMQVPSSMVLQQMGYGLPQQSSMGTIAAPSSMPMAPPSTGYGAGGTMPSSVPQTTASAYGSASPTDQSSMMMYGPVTSQQQLQPQPGSYVPTASGTAQGQAQAGYSATGAQTSSAAYGMSAAQAPGTAALQQMYGSMPTGAQQPGAATASSAYNVPTQASQPGFTSMYGAAQQQGMMPATTGTLTTGYGGGQAPAMLPAGATSTSYGAAASMQGMPGAVSAGAYGSMPLINGQSAGGGTFGGGVGAPGVMGTNSGGVGMAGAGMPSQGSSSPQSSTMIIVSLCMPGLQQQSNQPCAAPGAQSATGSLPGATNGFSGSMMPGSAIGAPGSAGAAGATAYGSPGQAGVASFGSPNQAVVAPYGTPGQVGAASYGSPGQAGAASYGSPGQAGAASYGSPGQAGAASYGSPGQAGAASYGSPGQAGAASYGSAGPAAYGSPGVQLPAPGMSGMVPSGSTYGAGPQSPPSGNGIMTAMAPAVQPSSYGAPATGSSTSFYGQSSGVPAQAPGTFMLMSGASMFGQGALSQTSYGSQVQVQPPSGSSAAYGSQPQQGQAMSGMATVAQQQPQMTYSAPQSYPGMMAMTPSIQSSGATPASYGGAASNVGGQQGYAAVPSAMVPMMIPAAPSVGPVQQQQQQGYGGAPQQLYGTITAQQQVMPQQTYGTGAGAGSMTMPSAGQQSYGTGAGSGSGSMMMPSAGQQAYGSTMPAATTGMVPSAQASSSYGPMPSMPTAMPSIQPPPQMAPAPITVTPQQAQPGYGGAPAAPASQAYGMMGGAAPGATSYGSGGSSMQQQGSYATQVSAPGVMAPGSYPMPLPPPSAASSSQYGMPAMSSAMPGLSMMGPSYAPAAAPAMSLMPMVPAYNPPAPVPPPTSAQGSSSQPAPSVMGGYNCPPGQVPTFGIGTTVPCVPAASPIGSTGGTSYGGPTPAAAPPSMQPPAYAPSAPFSSAPSSSMIAMNPPGAAYGAPSAGMGAPGQMPQMVPTMPMPPSSMPMPLPPSSMTMPLPMPSPMMPLAPGAMMPMPAPMGMAGSMMGSMIPGSSMMGMCPNGAAPTAMCSGGSSCPSGYGCTSGICCKLDTCPVNQQPVCQCTSNAMCPPGCQCQNGMCCAPSATSMTSMQQPGGQCQQSNQCSGSGTGGASCQGGSCQCQAGFASNGLGCVPSSQMPSWDPRSSCGQPFNCPCRLRFSAVAMKPVLQPEVTNQSAPIFYRPLLNLTRTCRSHATCTPEEICVNGSCLRRMVPGEYGCTSDAQCSHDCSSSFCDKSRSNPLLWSCKCKKGYAFAEVGLCYTECPEGTYANSGRCKVTKRTRQFWESENMEKRLLISHNCWKQRNVKLF